MGKRRETIYNELVQQCSKLSHESLLKRSGIPAQEIANQLGMLRSNVSSELNELVREERVVKCVTRPVLYLPAEQARALLGGTIAQYAIKASSLVASLNNEGAPGKKEDPFSHLIGVNESLKNSVKQAKSAIMYPPRGLHTLVLGPTGSGKTLFAHMMHNFSKYSKRMDEEAPFVEFNCADYYNNPQLLIGQLFGYVKGAFTGASHDQDGLVAEADKGILFLDEIHRLPPEGQEMLFYFMDTGRYSKLGEVGNKRQSQVLIIGATTADPESALLQTFLRRIPVMIKIPPFHERSVNEQIELTRFLLSREAHRTKNDFHVSADVVKALIGSVTFGNIGQLKSNVQLVCAQGFLDNMANDYVSLDAKMLPPEMLEGLNHIAHNIQINQQLNKLLPMMLIIKGEKDPLLAENDRYEPPYDMYQMILGQFDSLTREGLSLNEIHKFITEDIKDHVKNFYQQTAKDLLLTSADNRIVDLSKDLEEICSRALGAHLSKQFMSMLLVHLSAFLKAPDRKAAKSKDLDETILSYEKKDYQVSREIAELINRHLHIELPEVEVIYIAFLLGSFAELSLQKTVGIVVAAHGPQTASSMVSVVKELLGDHPIAAVDMPLSLNFSDIFEQIIHAVQSVDQGAGVLMMVDMGSLYYFEEKIAKESHVLVRAIDMVSTPMILDAVKDANLLHMDLKSIVDSLYHLRGVVSQPSEQTKSLQKKAILTICTTGSGIAQRIKSIVELFIRHLTDEDIEIIPVSIEGLYERAKKIQERYELMASIGAKNPKLEGVPYITLSQFVSGEGQDILQSIFSSKKMPIRESPSHIIVKGVCEDSLQDMLTYLNPKRAIDAILAFSGELQKTLNTHFKNATQIRMIMHLAFVLEREVTKTPLKYESAISTEKQLIKERLQKNLNVFEFKLNIQISDGEIYYFIDMMMDELGKSVLLDCISQA